MIHTRSLEEPNKYSACGAKISNTKDQWGHALCVIGIDADENYVLEPITPEVTCVNCPDCEQALALRKALQKNVNYGVRSTANHVADRFISIMDKNFGGEADARYTL